MILFWIFLLIGIGGGWEQGLIDTPTVLLLAGLTFILFVKEVKKLNERQRKSTDCRDYSDRH
ncbi:MAG: hypothetical protein GX326_05970 [Clostridiaceae bacterium]|nr:hypothetical protein [Clostridiaceae bacterium]